MLAKRITNGSIKVEINYTQKTSPTVLCRKVKLDIILLSINQISIALSKASFVIAAKWIKL